MSRISKKSHDGLALNNLVANALSAEDFFTETAAETKYQNDLLHAALQALELVVDEGLTFSSEQAADRVIARMKKSGV